MRTTSLSHSARSGCRSSSCHPGHPRGRRQPAPGLPQCVNTGGAEAIGGSNTECSIPGNVEINSTPAQQEFVGPWGNMWDEPGLFFP